MLSFHYHVPTEIYFGPGVTDRLPEVAKRHGARHIFLHYGSERLIDNGFIPQLEAALQAEGLCVSRFGGAKPNPRVECVREGAKRLRALGADFVLGVGGGSALDSAKAIALAAAHPEADIWDLWTGRIPHTACLPIGVILTLPATGTETSASSVLTNRSVGQKRGLSTAAFVPRFALLDPQLCLSLPPYQVACGVVDIMLHTMERFFNPEDGANHLTDELAAAVLRTVIAEGPAAFDQPTALGPMSEIMWAGSVSHNGLTGLGATGDWSTHQLGHVLSLLYDTAHGASLSAVWPAWARYACQKDATRFLRYARLVWGLEDADEARLAEAGIQATEAFWQRFAMPIRIQDLHLPDLDALLALPEGVARAQALDAFAARLAHHASYEGQRQFGSYPCLDEEAMAQIYRHALEA